MTPFLVETLDTWALVFDGVRILDGMTTFSAALQSWYATFFVFSVEYTSSLKHSCVFFEKYLLRRNVFATSAVTRLANRILPHSATKRATNPNLPILSMPHSPTESFGSP